MTAETCYRSFALIENVFFLDIEELSEDKYKLVKEHNVSPYSFDVDYDYWTTEQILYSVMPEGDAETPSSFTTTGHIGKSNLQS